MVDTEVMGPDPGLVRLSLPFFMEAWPRLTLFRVGNSSSDWRWWRGGSWQGGQAQGGGLAGSLAVLWPSALSPDPPQGLHYCSEHS